ncbi:MAG: glycoside hydrolase family 88 protein [Bacteroidetes bacterium]|nr:glycoside hydrolase family 88 protein [Bacteroidota bacterium]
MKRTTALLFLAAALLSAQSPSPDSRWSVRIADSFMRLHPDSIIYQDEAKSRRWNYEQGLMLESFYQVFLHTKDVRYREYMKRNLDLYILPDGSIATYRIGEYNIDNITPGVAVIRAYDLTGEQRYRNAADTLRAQLATHPRTKQGGFWHKKIYPYQMWLDGLYMASPFYTLYTLRFGPPEAFNDVLHQFFQVRQHLRDSVTGLYLHGWDESRAMRWADPKTGRSPNVWGRSMGWLAMAMVDVLDHLPASHPRRQELIGMFREYMDAVVRYRDTGTKLWFQVMDRPAAKGNYAEASASAMFVYALAKGVNKGYLQKDRAAVARESWEKLLGRFVTVDAAGSVFLHDVVKVSGLGGTPYRDGSYEYYLSEPLRTNDFKGYGPFLLSAIQIEMLQP